MKTLNFTLTSQPLTAAAKEVICGVVGSGNLEVLVDDSANPNQCQFVVNTSVTGFDHVWEAVLQEFVTRYAVGGLRFSLNDMGATPAVVSLRLAQAINLMEDETHG